MYCLVILQAVTSFLAALLTTNLLAKTPFAIRDFGGITWNRPPPPPPAVFLTSVKDFYAPPPNVTVTTTVTTTVATTTTPTATQSFVSLENGTSPPISIETDFSSPSISAFFRTHLDKLVTFWFSVLSVATEIIVAILRVLVIIAPQATVAFTLRDQRRRDLANLEEESGMSPGFYWDYINQVTDEDWTVAVLRETLARITRAAEEQRKEHDAFVQTLQTGQDAALQTLRKEQDAEKQTLRMGQDAEVQALRKEQDAFVQTLQTGQDAALQTLRKEQDAEKQTLRMGQDAEVQALRKEWNDHVQTLQMEQDARLQTLRKEQDAEVQTLRTGQDAMERTLRIIREQESASQETIRQLTLTVAKQATKLHSASQEANQRFTEAKELADKRILDLEDALATERQAGQKKDEQLEGARTNINDLQTSMRSNSQELLMYRNRARAQHQAAYGQRLQQPPPPPPPQQPHPPMPMQFAPGAPAPYMPMPPNQTSGFMGNTPPPGWGR